MVVPFFRSAKAPIVIICFRAFIFEKIPTFAPLKK